jgi:hypothetical protein
MENEHAILVVFAIMLVVVMVTAYAIKTVEFVNKGEKVDMPLPRMPVSLLPKRQWYALSIIRRSLTKVAPSVQEQIQKGFADLKLRGYDATTLSKLFVKPPKI